MSHVCLGQISVKIHHPSIKSFIKNWIGGKAVMTFESLEILMINCNAIINTIWNTGKHQSTVTKCIIPASLVKIVPVELGLMFDYYSKTLTFS